MNKAELVARCKQKEPSAQAELYRRYAGELFALCIRYAGNRETAKDLLHDGFLKAFTSLDKFDYRGEGSLKAWLSRIMVNTALEEARKQAQHFDVDLDEAPEVADPDSTDDGLVQQIAPEGYRTVFNLYTFENKSHKEIARLLHINEKSSSSQLYRARTLLMSRIKRYLAQHGDE